MAPTLDITSSATLLSAAALIWVALKLASKNKINLPPGPPSDPLIGHLRVLLNAHGREHMAFYELGQKYGDVVHLDYLGKRVVVVNGYEAANELLDKRGSIYSSRPRTVFNEIMGITQDLSLMAYGDDFRVHRRLFTKYFRQEYVKGHHSMQTREARALLKKLLANPADYEDHLFRFATAVTIEVAYGHTVTDKSDPYVKIADDVQKQVLPALVPTNPFAADLAITFPFLKYMPEWFPGAFHARRARNARKYVTDYYEYPMKHVSEQMVQFMTNLDADSNKGLQNLPSLQLSWMSISRGEADKAMNMGHIKGAAAMIYQAGTGTMHSWLTGLIASLLTHPECLKKVQSELDSVVGSDRLPTFEDRDSLPYLERCLWEVHRHNPTLPLLPHASVAEDIYDGVHIPKGSIIMGNVRGISWDERVYKNPRVYNPDRYAPRPDGPGEPPMVAAFGWGRRICPGRWFGTDSVFIAAASLLSTMDIKKPLDAQGKEYIPNIEFSFSGTASHPKPFECRIVPRSDMARKLISSEIE